MKSAIKVSLGVVALSLCQPIFAEGQSLADYPEAAAANGEHGTIRLQIALNPDGHVAECKVIRPSGAPELDEQACVTIGHGSFPSSAEQERRTGTFTIHYIMPNQNITESDLPIKSGEFVVIFNPAREEMRKKLGLAGLGKGHPSTRLESQKSPTFPPAAKRAGHEGSVRAVVEVSDAGKPVGCNVVRSSGYSDLDEATCSYAMRNARYLPAADYYGKPIRDYDLFGLNWKLH